MDGLDFTFDLFGAARRGTVTLRHPVETLAAVLRNDRMATCGTVTVISDTPIQALCGALAASGRASCAMQVRDRLGAAVCFVENVQAAADAGSRPA